ncbi:hypothetical protein CYMTET_48120 [Cymbomonas tetramitiformis]|uniref:Uncharacterized protein n=1 Tax=Cymbomonas tetramitiformis TaxID=36881 RepID=A0AAE0EX16_9CHLO|nr:hypothetical protein CYMTET_48120 [Cymbomonas tetramitiformis]
MRRRGWRRTSDFLSRKGFLASPKIRCSRHLACAPSPKIKCSRHLACAPSPEDQELSPPGMRTIAEDQVLPPPGMRTIAEDQVLPPPGMRTIGKDQVLPLPGMRTIAEDQVLPPPGMRTIAEDQVLPPLGMRTIAEDQVLPPPGMRTIAEDQVLSPPGMHTIPEDQVLPPPGMCTIAEDQVLSPPGMRTIGEDQVLSPPGMRTIAEDKVKVISIVAGSIHVDFVLVPSRSGGNSIPEPEAVMDRLADRQVFPWLELLKAETVLYTSYADLQSAFDKDYEGTPPTEDYGSPPDDGKGTYFDYGEDVLSPPPPYSKPPYPKPPSPTPNPPQMQPSPVPEKWNSDSDSDKAPGADDNSDGAMVPLQTLLTGAVAAVAIMGLAIGCGFGLYRLKTKWELAQYQVFDGLDDDIDSQLAEDSIAML